MANKLRMSNGNFIPFIGLGTGGKRSTPDEIILAVSTALEIGYRHIDTAFMYGNEHIIGQVIDEFVKSGKLKREELFVTTKLPPTAHRPADVERCLREQLKRLRLDYVDLYLIHTPTPLASQPDSWEVLTVNGQRVPDNVELPDTWRAMEAVYEKGMARAIGLSNFTLEQIQEIYQHAKVKPHNLQIEVHLFFPQRELHTMCTSLNITVTAYAPLGCPSKKGLNGWPDEGPIDSPIVARLAEKYSRTPAQILLRHLVQRGIVVVPKSVKPTRLRENFQIFDFSLTDDEMQSLNSVPPRPRLYKWEDHGMQKHPKYPFHDVIDTRNGHK